MKAPLGGTQQAGARETAVESATPWSFAIRYKFACHNDQLPNRAYPSDKGQPWYEFLIRTSTSHNG